MRKTLWCMIALLLAISIVGCSRQPVPADVSSAPEESTGTSVSVPSEEGSGLYEAESTPEDISLEESFPQETDLLQNGTILNEIRGEVFILETADEAGKYKIRFYARVSDGSLREFHTEDDFIDGYIDLYEDRVIFNDFSWEVISTVYLYDIGKDEKKQLDISGLPEYETVSAMKWLDGRYFLFVSQFDHGTVVRGGDVWVYDTETDEYFRIIDREDGRLQIHDMTVCDGMILFDVPYYDEGYTETEQHYYTVATETIYDLIENGTEMTFRAEEWVQ